MDQHSCEYWILWPDFQEILLWKHGFIVSRIELNLNYWLYLEQYARVIIQTKFLKIFYSKSGQISRFAQISHSTSVCTGNTIRQIILAKMASQTFHFSKIRQCTTMTTASMTLTWPGIVILHIAVMVYWIWKGWILPHFTFFTRVAWQTITPHTTTPIQIPSTLGCEFSSCSSIIDIFRRL